MNRHPTVKCINNLCPFADIDHYVEKVPGVAVHVHYSVDRQKKVVTILWIHTDSDPWPDEAERAEIRSKRED